MSESNKSTILTDSGQPELPASPPSPIGTETSKPCCQKPHPYGESCYCPCHSSYLGPIQTPIGRGPTPRPWVACGVSLAADKHSTERRCPILLYVTDANGIRRAVTIAYGVGPTAEIAIFYAKRIEKAINEGSVKA